MEVLRRNTIENPEIFETFHVQREQAKTSISSDIWSGDCGSQAGNVRLSGKTTSTSYVLSHKGFKVMDKDV